QRLPQIPELKGIEPASERPLKVPIRRNRSSHRNGHAGRNEHPERQYGAERAFEPDEVNRAQQKRIQQIKAVRRVTDQQAKNPEPPLLVYLRPQYQGGENDGGRNRTSQTWQQFVVLPA